MKWSDRIASTLIFLAIVGTVLGISYGIAAARGKGHSDDPCARSYQGPPRECIPALHTDLGSP